MGQKEIYSCEYAKHRVYSFINYGTILHTNNYKPTFAPPCICTIYATDIRGIHHNLDQAIGSTSTVGAVNGCLDSFILAGHLADTAVLSLLRWNGLDQYWLGIMPATREYCSRTSL